MLSLITLRSMHESKYIPANQKRQHSSTTWLDKSSLFRFRPSFIRMSCLKDFHYQTEKYLCSSDLEQSAKGKAEKLTWLARSNQKCECVSSHVIIQIKVSLEFEPGHHQCIVSILITPRKYTHSHTHSHSPSEQLVFIMFRNYYWLHFISKSGTERKSMLTVVISFAASHSLS